MVKEMNKSNSLENDDLKKNKVLPEIGKQIDKVRFTHGYSRPALSKGTGIANTQLHETINGKLNPTLDALDRIASFLDVPNDYLLIAYHDDFLLYAIDDYLYRIQADSFEMILNALSFIGIQPETLQLVKEQTEGFVRSVEERCSAPKLQSWKEKIRRFRKEAGYSQLSASEAIGVSYNHYVKFENEITGMTLPPYLRICLLYQKSSESISRKERNDMILTKEQIEALRRLSRKELIILLETLRVVYENSR